MPTLKQIKTSLNFIKRNKHQPILQNVLVKRDGLYATNLETSVLIKDTFGLDEGLHHINTLGLVDGVNDANMIEQMPVNEMSTDKIDKQLLNCDELKDLLNYVKDETRLYLNGIAISCDHLVATNGHIMKSYGLHEKCDNSYIMPSDSIKILLKLCKLYKLENIEVIFSESFAVIDNSMFTVKMRLIEREYPKWQAVVPVSFNKQIKVSNWINYKELKPLIKEHRSNAVKLKSIEGNVVLIPSKYPNNQYIIGKCDDEFDIGFNCEYLNIAAKGDAAFTIKYNNNINAINVNGAIVMPLKL